VGCAALFLSLFRCLLVARSLLARCLLVACFAAFSVDFPSLVSPVMNPYTHSALLAVGLFALTFFSPGPNLLVVIHASLARGRRAGLITGLGVACGDAIYSALGLFGMAALIAQGGLLFAAIKVAGGVYLVWYAIGLLRGHAPLQLEPGEAALASDASGFSASGFSLSACFRRGLITDLANPQTVLFFASIFSITLTADTPLWAKALAWAGIVAASLTWRVFLSHAFSVAAVRRGYARAQGVMERLVGAGLALFGARLIYQGLQQR
jgi:amino acid exporter